MALSPMMQQYVITKEKYKDAILLYRLGDFYEMFFEDAIKASKALDLTLTGKMCGLEERGVNLVIEFLVELTVFSANTGFVQTQASAHAFIDEREVIAPVCIQTNM